MTDKKSLYSFAVKWAEKFRDPSTDNKTLESNFLARDCDALGFKMDCGKAFEEKYGEAAYDTAKLKEIINDVTIQLFSVQRYIHAGDISIIGHRVRQ